jgi:hypothetical protein
VNEQDPDPAGLRVGTSFGHGAGVCSDGVREI